MDNMCRFREVETLFHEFGHGLQHMLTSVDYHDASGTLDRYASQLIISE